MTDTSCQEERSRHCGDCQLNAVYPGEKRERHQENEEQKGDAGASVFTLGCLKGAFE